MSLNRSDLPAAIADELLCIADTKWVLGHWYIKLILNGRSLTDFNALAAMAQDQLGHTRSLFSLLEDRGYPASQLEFGRSRFEVHNMELLDEPPKNWADFLVTASLAEYALRVLFASYENSTDKVLGQFAMQCERESEFHSLYLDGGLMGLSSDEKQLAIESLLKRYPLALRWFGSTSVDLPHVEGFRKSSLEDLRKDFVRLCNDGIASHLQSELPPKDMTCENPWDWSRRRPQGSAMPATLWEFVLPTNEQAVMCRRPIIQSTKDSIRFTTTA